MRTLALFCTISAALFLSGCTGVKIVMKAPDGTEATFRRWTCCNTTELPELDYTNGVIRVRGLNTAPDKETLQKAADVAAAAAVKALAGGL